MEQALIRFAVIRAAQAACWRDMTYANPVTRMLIAASGTSFDQHHLCCGVTEPVAFKDKLPANLVEI